MALALKDTKGHFSVLVTSDIIGFTAEFADSISNEITKKTGLERFQILLNSSHTHTGPALQLDATKIDFPEDQKTATVQFTRSLRDKLVELVEQSLRDFQPAKLSWGTGVAPFCHESP